MVHEGGFTIALTDGAHVEIRTPSGGLLPSSPPLAPDAGAVEWEGDWWTARDHADALQTWQGDRPDYDLTVAGLMG